MHIAIVDKTEIVLSNEDVKSWVNCQIRASEYNYQTMKNILDKKHNAFFGYLIGATIGYFAWHFIEKNIFVIICQ